MDVGSLLVSGSIVETYIVRYLIVLCLPGPGLEFGRFLGVGIGVGVLPSGLL